MTRAPLAFVIAEIMPGIAAEDLDRELMALLC